MRSTSIAFLFCSFTVKCVDAFIHSNAAFKESPSRFLNCAREGLFSHRDIEPYVGPVGSMLDMEGGIAISQLALNVFTGPSLVASGRGLFLCIYDDIDDEEGSVEEIIIPQGTPICGYARGYFTDEAQGDKSVGFLFKESSADMVSVFYNQELITLGDAVWSVFEERCAEGNLDSGDLLFGHHVEVDSESGKVVIKSDEEFLSRIFIPDTPEDDQFAATSLGVYANDLAYDPDSNEQEYFENSGRNNILQLVWRLAKDEKNGMLVPTWPVVVVRKDVRLLNSVPMEVGVEYGFNYWDQVAKDGTSKYIPQ